MPPAQFRAVGGGGVEASSRLVAVGRLCELGPVIESVTGRGLLRLVWLLCRSVYRAVGGGGIEASSRPVTVGRLCELSPVVKSVTGRGLLCLRVHLDLDRAVSGGRIDAAPRAVAVVRLCELVPVIENLRLPHVAVVVANNRARPVRVSVLSPRFDCHRLWFFANCVSKRASNRRTCRGLDRTYQPVDASACARYTRSAARVWTTGPPLRAITGDDLTPGLTRQGNRPSSLLEYLSECG